MTRSQKKWLVVLHRVGFVESGGWGRGQRNRPLRALVREGLAEESYGPRNSLLTVHGYLAPADFIGPFMPATSETLSSVCAFLGGRQ